MTWFKWIWIINCLWKCASWYNILLRRSIALRTSVETRMNKVDLCYSKRWKVLKKARILSYFLKYKYPESFIIFLVLIWARYFNQVGTIPFHFVFHRKMSMKLEWELVFPSSGLPQKLPPILSSQSSLMCGPLEFSLQNWLLMEEFHILVSYCLTTSEAFQELKVSWPINLSVRNEHTDNSCLSGRFFGPDGKPIESMLKFSA